MLEDELLLVVVGLQHHRILVERTYPPGELHPAEQINRNRRFVPARIVQERILDVLCRLGFHSFVQYGD